MKITNIQENIQNFLHTNNRDLSSWKLRECIGMLEVKMTLFIVKRYLVPDFMESNNLSILTSSSLFI